MLYSYIARILRGQTKDTAVEGSAISLFYSLCMPLQIIDITVTFKHVAIRTYMKAV